MMIYKAAALLMFAALPTDLALPALAQTAGVDNTETSMADGIRNPNKRGPALTGGRRPLYRLRKSDVVEIQFTFSPEFDQAVTIQPDGFVALKAVDSVFAEGLTLTELHDAVVKVYQRALRDPEVSVLEWLSSGDAAVALAAVSEPLAEAWWEWLAERVGAVASFGRSLSAAARADFIRRLSILDRRPRQRQWNRARWGADKREG